VSAQRLSEKSTRRLSRATGLEIVRAWAHGGYTFDFVVADPESPVAHRHGWYDKKTGNWALLDEHEDRHLHYNTCPEMFPVKQENHARGA
jgi:hypothetical protein